MKNRIESIKVMREVDVDADTSYLGEYSREAGPHAIDRQERGECERNEYRYFNPAMSGDETGNPDSPEQDYQRMESLNRGAWCFMGIYARAEVIVNGTIQHLQSGGLWGIESDSDAEYFTEVAREQLSELADILKSTGFTSAQVKAAMPAGVEFVDG